jgi:hypothetical protein
MAREYRVTIHKNFKYEGGVTNLTPPLPIYQLHSFKVLDLVDSNEFFMICVWDELEVLKKAADYPLEQEFEEQIEEQPNE